MWVSLRAKFRLWRETRSEQKRLKKEQRELLKAQQAAAQNALKVPTDLSPEERIAQFMKDSAEPALNAEAISRGDQAGAQMATDSRFC